MNRLYDRFYYEIAKRLDDEIARVINRGGIMGTQRFRKKPVVVEAIRYDGTNAEEIRRWSSDGAVSYAFEFDPSILSVRTEEGTMRAMVGDWIVRGTRGEYYPVKPAPFADTFEPAPKIGSLDPFKLRETGVVGIPRHAFEPYSGIQSDVCAHCSGTREDSVHKTGADAITWKSLRFEAKVPGWLSKQGRDALREHWSPITASASPTLARGAREIIELIDSLDYLESKYRHGVMAREWLRKDRNAFCVKMREIDDAIRTWDGQKDYDTRAGNIRNMVQVIRALEISRSAARDELSKERARNDQLVEGRDRLDTDLKTRTVERDEARAEVARWKYSAYDAKTVSISQEEYEALKRMWRETGWGRAATYRGRLEEAETLLRDAVVGFLLYLQIGGTMQGLIDRIRMFLDRPRWRDVRGS